MIEKGLSDSKVLELICDLTAKSLLTADVTSRNSTYRYLETMRIYGREKLTESGAEPAVCAAHAMYFKGLLTEAEQQLNELSTSDWVTRYGGYLAEVRSALYWTYIEPEFRILSVDITILAASFFSQLSLENESMVWIDRALASVPLDENVENMQRRMKLSVWLGQNRAFGLGLHKEDELVCEAGSKLALSLGNVDYALRGVWCLFHTAISAGDDVNALALADKLSELARRSEDPLDAAAAERAKALVHQVFGELPQAERHLAKSIELYETRTTAASWLRYGVDIRVAARRSMGHVFMASKLSRSGYRDNAAEFDRLFLHWACEESLQRVGYFGRATFRMDRASGRCEPIQQPSPIGGK